MLKCIFIILIGFIVFHTTHGQSSFHRTYPSVKDKDIICLSSMQTKDGNFVAMELELESKMGAPFKSDTLLITSYKPKGDINWSKAIAIDTAFGSLAYSLGSIVQGDNDSLYFSFITTVSIRPSKIIGALAAGGQDGWIKSYTSLTTQSDGTNFSHLLTNYNKSIFSTHVGGSTTENDLALSRKNYQGNNTYAKRLSAKDNIGRNVSERVSSFSFEKDSTLLLSGVVDSTNLGSFILVTDTLGNVKWSKKYRTTNATTIGQIQSYGSVRLPDSTYVLAGVLTKNNAKSRGFVLKTKKNGDVDWGQIIRFEEVDNTIINHISLDQSNNILLSGTNTDTISKIPYIFAMKMNVGGSKIWSKKYPKVEGREEYVGRLFGTKDGGSALISSVKENAKIRPSFIKLDANGSTSCEEDITQRILYSEIFVADTLIWTSVNAGAVINTTFKSKPNTYDVPVLSLNVRPFCPEEPIDWTFRATTKGAVFYNWSTGDKGPLQDTLRVFKEDKYSVTVTIGEMVCYMLCDTVELSRYKKPMAELGLTLGNFCTNGLQTLSAGYIPGHPQVKSFAWSTGQTNVAIIEIAQPGTYSVTIVDQCDERAIASATVGAFPKKITTATIAGQVVIDCFGANATGTLTATGNSSGLGAERYQWSSGQSTRAITINDTAVKTYTVTVTDLCNTTATGTYALEFKGAGITNASITVNKDNLCTAKTIRLNALADRAGVFQYNWSITANTPSINVDKEGTYTVTITDICGNSSSATADIKADDLTPKDIIYANVFFPDGVGYRFQPGADSSAFAALTLNRTFGPINLPDYCLNQVENYEFYVFNRWGQKVFESKDIQLEWDGKINDKDSPADTYIWVAKYKIFGFEKTLKGDMSMIRL